MASHAQPCRRTREIVVDGSHLVKAQDTKETFHLNRSALSRYLLHIYYMDSTYIYHHSYEFHRTIARTPVPSSANPGSSGCGK
jgi:hypothetical protein